MNPSEVLRRIAGIGREARPIARPSLLVIEIVGLSRTSLQTALKKSAMPFLQKLLSEEQYELFPLKFEKQLAEIVRETETKFKSQERARAQALPPPFSWSPPAKLWAGVDIAAGRPLVHLRLAVEDRPQSAGEANQGKKDLRLRLEDINRSIRSLYGKALLSATADYEVWILSEGPDGFALLPANIVRPQAPDRALDAATAALAMQRASGRPIGDATGLHSATTSEKALRVMTYNIHSCVGLDGKLAPSRIARIVRGFDPDIVALQEVDLKRSRSKGEDQAARLAHELNMQVAFCCTADRGWERYGHALLTRIPATVIASGLFSGETKLSEPRGALLARIEMRGRSIYVANTHFGLSHPDRSRQAQTFLGTEWLARVPAEAPLIVCGDFNMKPDSLPYELISKQVKDAQLVAKVHEGSGTFPSPFPMTRLDFIFLSNHFAVERISVVNNTQTRVASDHLPVVADLISA